MDVGGNDVKNFSVNANAGVFISKSNGALFSCNIACVNNSDVSELAIFLFAFWFVDAIIVFDFLDICIIFRTSDANNNYIIIINIQSIFNNYYFYF